MARKHTTTPRGSQTRQRLIDTAIELFGIHGFDGVTTRQLARHAAVNLAAIPYHFDSKEGLYRAAAKHIAAQVAGQVAPDMSGLNRTAGDLSKPEAARQLRLVLNRFCQVIVASGPADKWARFVIREQMNPTPAFDLLFERISKGPLHLVTDLVAVLMESSPRDENVRIRAFALIGQALIFRTAREAVLRWLGWRDIGDDEIAAIETVIDGHIAAVFAGERK